MTADRPFEGAFPRLIEGFNDVDIKVSALAEREHVLDDPCLVDRRWQGPFSHAACARPADFADEDFLAWKRVDDLPANGIDVCPGPAGGNRKVLPIGQDMNGDEIDGIGDVTVTKPEFPDVRIGHRHPHPCLDGADRPREVGRRHVPPQKDLVADDDGADGFRVLVRERDGCLDLIVVFGGMAGQPQSLHDLEPVFGGDPGDLVEAEIDRVCPDAVCDFRKPGQVVVDLGCGDHRRGIKRGLQAAEGRIRHAIELLRPPCLGVRHENRAAEPNPDTGNRHHH